MADAEMRRSDVTSTVATELASPRLRLAVLA